ncbi:PREDICTED: dual adapter for phosphotyrosine and 3-phosphotyrosine and 3-phosphoinositide-like [Amphimedon queenslandica]|uniref:Dual adapter for phosphotyrosine and 3-phosphotyrosine and 3-phosphoinositide n=1 Tax=Amphimedon queenslandica TaxID=400682 RepID=A0A1X7VVU2_AMPQE|nr:PREDICTED: dual adapter for phosphotyrosine and 3-phosphotyrosine and 3-phosphoinositide-like [Amphimedon queenslandica]|eukprot:XP_003382588.3 PREDICTED: dual adapter for phosphotyrosine and 3-phosphotyrosine and 3-phosphoinositide-like [Amphimedon queenslandica]
MVSEMAVATKQAITVGAHSPGTTGLRGKKVSTLHREKELRPVTYNGSDSSEEEEENNDMIVSRTPPQSTAPGERWKIEHRPSLPFEVCQREAPDELKVAASFSTGSLQTSPLLTNSKLHQHFAAAKLAKKTSAPKYMDIPWYHPKINRHIAESLLLSKSTPEGTFLLRDSGSTENTLTLSVKYKDSIKHYRVTWDGKHLCFGLGKFKNIPEFLEHFDSQPVISGDSGLLVYLSHPYPRCVKEFVEYEEPVIMEGPDGATVGGDKSPAAIGSSVTSKSGYLTKLGYHRKNWKLRWFRLFRAKLCYYSTKDSLVPLKEINISDATSIERDTSSGKEFCFKLVTSYRTFYMYAESESEADEWVRLIKSKLANKR